MALAVLMHGKTGGHSPRSCPSVRTVSQHRMEHVLLHSVSSPSLYLVLLMLVGSLDAVSESGSAMLVMELLELGYVTQW